MTTQPREPNDSEFDAITANLPELAALDHERQDQFAAPAPAPALTQPEQQPTDEAVDLETEMRRDGYRPPAGPDDTHELPVSFKLRHAIKAGFGMTVLAAAVGQTLFFAGFFGGGLLGYGLAVLIAAFAEVTMIGSGDAALRHKVEGNQGWQLLLAVSALVAVGATVMQVAHWTAEDQPVMALTFGAASLLGWIVHITSGLITAAGYLARRAEWDAELARRRRKRESRADAVHERRQAEWETQQQATQRAVATLDKTSTSEPASQAKPTKAKPAKARKAPGRATKDDAVRLGVAEQAATPAALRAALTRAGYELPKSPSTVESWCREIKTRLRS